eukprot:1160444-Pelagomonas_calceolata.AAC.6
MTPTDRGHLFSTPATRIPSRDLLLAVAPRAWPRFRNMTVAELVALPPPLNTFPTAPIHGTTSAPKLPPGTGTCARPACATSQVQSLASICCCWSAASMRVCRCMQDACRRCPGERGGTTRWTFAPPQSS